MRYAFFGSVNMQQWRTDAPAG